MYPYLPPIFRAACINVVDGDTVDLVVDIGFRVFTKLRFRLLGIDTPELNSKVAEERQQAQAAKARVIEKLCPVPAIDLGCWTLRVTDTKKDPDSFGRWLARIHYQAVDGEHCINDELISSGLAAPYTP